MGELIDPGFGGPIERHPNADKTPKDKPSKPKPEESIQGVQNPTQKEGMREKQEELLSRFQNLKYSDTDIPSESSEGMALSQLEEDINNFRRGFERLEDNKDLKQNSYEGQKEQLVKNINAKIKELESNFKNNPKAEQLIIVAKELIEEINLAKNFQMSM